MRVEMTGLEEAQEMLEKLPIAIRGRALKKAVMAACKVVVKEAKRRAPIGDKRHKPGKKALAKTIIAKVKGYGRDGSVMVGIVGPSYPEGAHGHLVEGGHKIRVSRGPRKGKSPLSGSASVPGKAFLAPAVDSTAEEQERVMIATIVAEIKKAGG